MRRLHDSQECTAVNARDSSLLKSSVKRKETLRRTQYTHGLHTGTICGMKLSVLDMHLCSGTLIPPCHAREQDNALLDKA